MLHHTLESGRSYVSANPYRKEDAVTPEKRKRFEGEVFPGTHEQRQDTHINEIQMLSRRRPPLQ